jgi:hypothetical protein
MRHRLARQATLRAQVAHAVAQRRQQADSLASAAGAAWLAAVPLLPLPFSGAVASTACYMLSSCNSSFSRRDFARSG